LPVQVDLVHYLVYLEWVKSVNVHEAKTHFSKLLARVERGQEILISRAGKPVARLVPHASERPAPVFGADRGKLVVPADFDTPLPDDVLAAFEGRAR
jgi:prevent-host-death family protein